MKRLHVAGVTVGLSFLLTGTAGLAEPPAGAKREILPVFVLAGQSNMVGVGAKTNAAQLPVAMQEQTNVVFVEFWDTNLTKPLKPKNNIGPEVAFGYEMARALNTRIGIIKIAYGGSSLAGPWNPNPAKFDKEKSVGIFYRRMIDYVRDVKKANPNMEIAGMLWMQGEADSRYGKIQMEDYRNLLEMLVAGCRQEFGCEKMPFVCARIAPPANWPNREQVRNAQVSARIDQYAWMDCDGLELGGDSLHFTLNGQLEMGRGFARAMLSLMRVTEKK
jgi:hypothetical protein